MTINDMHVIGFISNDNEAYKKHSKVLIACLEAGIEELPKETAEFFKSKTPYKGLLEEILTVKIPHTVYKDDMNEGYDIKLSEVPKEVSIIRVYNSY